MKTMHLSPTTVLVGMEINLINELDTDEIEMVTEKIEEKILTIIPDSKKEYIFCERRKKTLQIISTRNPTITIKHDVRVFINQKDIHAYYHDQNKKQGFY